MGVSARFKQHDVGLSVVANTPFRVVDALFHPLFCLGDTGRDFLARGHRVALYLATGMFGFSGRTMHCRAGSIPYVLNALLNFVLDIVAVFGTHAQGVPAYS